MGDFKLPEGMSPEMFTRAIRAQYEQEFQGAFGVTPVEAAHLFAHFRDGYLGLLDELVGKYDIPPMVVKPEPNMAEDAPYTERYVMAGWVLPFLPAAPEEAEPEEAEPCGD